MTDAVTAPGAMTSPKPAGKPAAEEAPRKPLASDFETFLRMLTVQMQNQDPLNPIDSADYAVQLATFSGVEQQVRTNQLLAGMGGQFGLLGMAQMANWIGQEARTPEAVTLKGSGVPVYYQSDPKADRAVLVVRNAAGQVLSREEVPPKAASLIWEGMDPTGVPLPEGTYRLSLECWQGEEKLSTRPVEGYAEISEVQNGPDGPVIVLAGGISLAAAKVTALRRAQ